MYTERERQGDINMTNNSEEGKLASGRRVPGQLLGTGSLQTRPWGT